MSDDWIPMAAAVQLSGYHHVTIRKLLLSGRIKGRKWGGIWQISKASLQAYLSGTEKLGEKRGPKRRLDNL